MSKASRHRTILTLLGQRPAASQCELQHALSKRGIYFLEGTPSDANLHVQFLSFATHIIQTIGMVPGPVVDEISVSPDERWLLFGTRRGAGSELMLIENFH